MPTFTAPEFEVVTSGVVSEAITRFLEADEDHHNPVVLDEVMAAVKKLFLAQVMRKRKSRKGYESTTCFSGPCARKSRYVYDGTKGEGITARSRLKFILGDSVELYVLAIAKLAGLDIGMNNEDLTVQGRDGVLINCHPDGILLHDGVYSNIEVKSTDSRTFDEWMDKGRPGDMWGYETQASVEIQAWREAGFCVTHTRLIAVSTGSRIGSVAEFLLPYNADLIEAWHDRRALVHLSDLPPIPFQLEQELEYKRGKEVSVDDCLHGDPIERKDKNGKTHGWDVPTGAMVLPMMCGYCDYKAHCYPTAQMDMQGGRPVWKVPPVLNVEPPEAQKEVASPVLECPQDSTAPTPSALEAAPLHQAAELAWEAWVSEMKDEHPAAIKKIAKVMHLPTLQYNGLTDMDRKYIKVSVGDYIKAEATK